MRIEGNTYVLTTTEGAIEIDARALPIDVQGMIALGDRYYQGEGIEQSYKEARVEVLNL